MTREFDENIETVDEKYQHLKSLVTQLFEYLDRVEESDSGNLFHPIFISCCRANQTAPLSALLSELKKAALITSKN